MSERIPLSPIDHLFTGANAYPISLVFDYEGKLDSARLRASLEATLEDFAPLRSTLIESPKGSLAFAPSPKGYTFTEQTSGTPIDYVQSQIGEPLLKVVLTQGSGPARLGISVSHAAVDGYSYFFFLTAWSKRLRGEAYAKPSHDRTKLIPKLNGNGDRLDRQAVFDRSGWFWNEKRRTPNAHIRRESVPMSKVMIDELCAKHDIRIGLSFSFNDVIAAHLWQRFGNDGISDVSAPRFLTCPYDFRRLVPELGATYFGNAVVGAVIQAEAAELRSLDLKELVTRVRDGVRAIRRENVDRSLETLERLRLQEGLTVTEELNVLQPQTGFLITNLSRLPMQELDFGAGIPQKIEFLTPIEGTGVVLPALGGLPEGFDIQVCHRSAASVNSGA